MDVLKELEKIKSTKTKLEARKKIIQALKERDEEFYFEEETRDMTSWNFINSKLILHDNAYFTKVVPEEGPFCVTCWEDNHQLNAVKKTDKKGIYLCLVCDVKNK